MECSCTSYGTILESINLILETMHPDRQYGHNIDPDLITHMIHFVRAHLVITLINCPFIQRRSI